MEDFRPTRIEQYAPLPLRTTAEARRWLAYRPVRVTPVGTAPNTVEFAPLPPHDLAVTCAARVALWSARTGQWGSAISRVRGTAYSGRYRGDGRLLVLGTDGGAVQVHDAVGRSLLRVLEGHTAVRNVRFTVDKLRVVSASDDRSVRVWDLPTEKCLLRIPHPEYVRAQASCATAPHLWLTGCYDRRVRLFDLRAGSGTPVRQLEHSTADQVDDVCFLPGGDGALAASAGGPLVRIWDVVRGGRGDEAADAGVVASLSSHSKAVMSLCVDESKQRLLSGSLDCTIQVYDWAQLSWLHTLTLPSGIRSVAISPDGTSLAAALVDGTVDLRRQTRGAAAITASPEAEVDALFARVAQGHLDRDDPTRPYRPGTKRYFLRGMWQPPDATQDDQVFGERTRDGRPRHRRKLQRHDRHLRKFEYRKALDAALESEHAAVAVSVLEELRRRNGLDIALGRRTPTELLPLLRLLTSHLADARYAPLLLLVAHRLLDGYAEAFGQDAQVDAAFRRLQHAVQRQVRANAELRKLHSVLEMIA
eukprot:ctg_1623.g513